MRPNAKHKSATVTGAGAGSRGKASSRSPYEPNAMPSDAAFSVGKVPASACSPASGTGGSTTGERSQRNKRRPRKTHWSSPTVPTLAAVDAVHAREPLGLRVGNAHEPDEFRQPKGGL